MPTEPLILTIGVAQGEPLGPREFQDLSANLAAELRRLDAVESVARAPAGAAPKEAKSAELAALGTLMLRLLPKASWDKLAEVITAWIRRHDGKTLTTEWEGRRLELKGYGPKETSELVRFLTQKA